MQKILVVVAALLTFSASALLAAPLVAKPEEAFKKSFPTIKVDAFTEGPVAGSYEVTTGAEIIFYFPEKDLLFAGNIFNKEFKNLVEEKKQALRAKKQAEALQMLKDLPLGDAVKVGNGPKKVIEFTDPDCPYCRRASEALKNRTDITRYVFLTPLAHPNAINKVHYILSAKDQEAAYHEMMAGKPLPDPKASFSMEVKVKAQEYLSIARSMGIDGTPTFFINGQQVVGADMEKIDALLK
ncbi:MAG: DsbC family protein [Geobacter sp.]|nr:DsbC family protein [Geobacter sp.]